MISSINQRQYNKIVNRADGEQCRTRKQNFEAAEATRDTACLCDETSAALPGASRTRPAEARPAEAAALGGKVRDPLIHPRKEVVERLARISTGALVLVADGCIERWSAEADQLEQLDVPRRLPSRSLNPRRTLTSSSRSSCRNTPSNVSIRPKTPVRSCVCWVRLFVCASMSAPCAETSAPCWASCDAMDSSSWRMASSRSQRLMPEDERAHSHRGPRADGRQGRQRRRQRRSSLHGAPIR